MELSAPTDSVQHRGEPSAAALQPLRVSYEYRESASAVLAESDVLAVIGFGNAALDDDERCLRVALEPADGTAPLEIWRAPGSVLRGRAPNLRWSSAGNFAFVALEIAEREHGGIAGAAQTAYASLFEWCRASATPHLLRIWNYFEAINDGVGDAERYRLFCNGRAAGMGPVDAANFPAASAIGTRADSGILQVYALAARNRGVPVENPRQWNAWTYPRRYGPTAPGFARGLRAPTLSPQLYISGTAAVVGHASHHPGDIRAQLDETCANLSSLLDAASSSVPLGAGSVLKAYVRNEGDVAEVAASLRERFGQAQLLLLRGDICRSELLIEIDGIHAG